MADRRRGSIIDRGDNKHLIRVYIGVSPDGKRQYSAETFEGTISQAQKRLTAILGDVDKKLFVSPEKTTLREYLGVPVDDEKPVAGWLASKIDISARSQRSYRTQLGYVVAKIGHLKLHELDKTSIQSVITWMSESSLSPRTIEYTYRVLHSALEDAVESKLLVRNPSNHVKLPKKIKRAPSVLTMKQVSLFLEKTKDDLLSALWRLLLTSGLRPGEALALKWTDLDLEGKWIAVQRTLVDDGQGACELVEGAKTEGSMRTIGIPLSTVEALQAHKARQNAEILLAGAKYERLGLVFANSLGRPLDHNAVRRRWKAGLKAAGLPKVRLYDTRHTHLTALLANGADIAWVASRAGHKDIKMTQQHYAHVRPETHREMGDMTERMLQREARAAAANGGK